MKNIAITIVIILIAFFLFMKIEHNKKEMISKIENYKKEMISKIENYKIENYKKEIMLKNLELRIEKLENYKLDNKKNTNIDEYIKDNIKFLYFHSDNKEIYYKCMHQLEINNAYLINLAKYDNDYKAITDISKTLKQDVMAYFQKFNNSKKIEFLWNDLANDIDALLIIEIKP